MFFINIFLIFLSKQANKHKTKQLDEDGFIELMESFPPPANTSTKKEEDDEAPDSSFLDIPMSEIMSPVTKASTASPRSIKSVASGLSQASKPSPLASQSQSQERKEGLTPRALSLGSQTTMSPYSQNTQSPSVSTESKIQLDYYK